MSEPPADLSSEWTLRELASPRATIRHLRSPHSGLIGQLARYGAAGGFVTLVYLTITTVLSQVVGLPFEVALAIGFVCALALHFNLQRLFVWIHHEEFALPIRQQVGRYLAMACTQYAITALSTAVLPSATGLPTEVIYLLTLAVVTIAGFLLMRFVIFHADPSGTDTTRDTPSQ
jgi:putative flippase GtrA